MSVGGELVIKHRAQDFRIQRETTSEMTMNSPAAFKDGHLILAHKRCEPIRVSNGARHEDVQKHQPEFHAVTTNRAAWNFILGVSSFKSSTTPLETK
mmetsp:Transcript_15429/g.22636  ORF Transcript_15429/g.22636 Transcript_15429/m.22636 type:complete len:97 (-) Transcript_15429:206-496(-)